MKSSSKDRMILSIIAIFYLLALAALGYMMFGNHKPTGMYTAGVKIINEDNVEKINEYKKNRQSYAIKVRENDKLYLNYTYYQINQPVVCKLTLTNKQYNKLLEDKQYWFNIKFHKPGDSSMGTILTIYTDNPMRN